MGEYLGFLTLGVGAGAIVAVMALGLVMCQQGASMVNFSIGATMTWVVHVYADLRNGAYVFPLPGLPDRYHFNDDVGFVWALLLSMVTAVLLGWVLFRLVFQPLRGAPSISTIVANIGVIIVMTSLVERRFSGGSGLRTDEIFPNDSVPTFGGISMPQDGLWVAGTVGVLSVGLWALYRFSRIGLVTRAAATNEKGVVLLGYSPVQLARTSYISAVVLTSLVGILASPMLQLQANTFTFLFLTPALGAALVGRFASVPITVGVAFAIAMVQSTFTKFQVDYDWWPRFGMREGLPFVVIIIAMWLLGETLPSRAAVNTWRLPAVPQSKLTPVNVGTPIVLALLGLLVLDPTWRAAIMTSTIAVVFALSFVVVTGFGGQTTLAQMAIAGVAGFSLSKLAVGAGIPFPIAPLLAASVAAVAGTVVGLPAMRIRGTNLAIVTLGGSVAITEFVFKNPSFVGDVASGGAQVPNPSFAGWDFGLVLGSESSRPIFGVFLVLVATVLALAVSNIRRGMLGVRLLAVRSNEKAAMAAGVDVARTKLTAYGISSFIAGIGGCLIAYRFGRVSDASFGTFASLAALAVAYLGGITSVSGAVTAGLVAASGVAFFGMSELIGGLGPWEALIGGALLILTAVLNPQGIAGGFHRPPKQPEDTEESEGEPVAQPALAGSAAN